MMIWLWSWWRRREKLNFDSVWIFVVLTKRKILNLQRLRELSTSFQCTHRKKPPRFALYKNDRHLFHFQMKKFIMSVFMAMDRCRVLRRFRKICEQPLSASSWLSVRPHTTSRLPLDGFWWNLISELFFQKYVVKIQVSLQSDKNNGYFTWRPMYVWQYFAELF